MDTPLHSEAHVDLAAVRHNVGVLRGRAPDSQVLAVVKADGYGHGMVPVARAALQGGADWIGVAVADEALALRAAGIGDAPVLCWLTAPGEPIAELIAASVDVAAYAPWQIAEITAAAAACGRPARVHLKVDTGLGRGGSTPAEWAALLEAATRARADGLLTIEGVWSHLACADEPEHPANEAQERGFADALEAAARAGVHPPLRHLANSAGTLLRPGTHYDLVRPGLAVYGLSPAPSQAPAERLGLVPAMTLRGRLALVKRVPAGHGVSYGHRYVTDRATTLGLVPMGYADGIPRAATNRGPLGIGGRRHRIAGTVCMDQFVVDLGDQDAAAGDPVVLFGNGTDGEPTAEDWATAVDTISYEIVTRIGSRVPRTYEGEV